MVPARLILHYHLSPGAPRAPQVVHTHPRGVIALHPSSFQTEQIEKKEGGKKNAKTCCVSSAFSSRFLDL
jgi:hypothetical protein